MKTIVKLCAVGFMIIVWVLGNAQVPSQSLQPTPGGGIGITGGSPFQGNTAPTGYQGASGPMGATSPTYPITPGGMSGPTGPAPIPGVPSTTGTTGPTGKHLQRSENSSSFKKVTEQVICTREDQ